MWSQWVWLTKTEHLMGIFFFPNSPANELPSSRIPVPASRIIISSSSRNSTQAVFPPYLTNLIPGVGSDPLTPQNFTFIKIMPLFRYLYLIRYMKISKVFCFNCRNYPINKWNNIVWFLIICPCGSEPFLHRLVELRILRWNSSRKLLRCPFALDEHRFTLQVIFSYLKTFAFFNTKKRRPRRIFQG